MAFKGSNEKRNVILERFNSAPQKEVFLFNRISKVYFWVFLVAIGSLPNGIISLALPFYCFLATFRLKHYCAKPVRLQVLHSGVLYVSWCD